MQKRFLVSVGEVVAMQGNNVVFTGKTLLDSGISISTSNVEIRGGVSNPLQAVYYHSGAFNITITETQFSLPLIALNSGSSIAAGGDIWSQETVTLNNSTGTITGTPVSIAGQTISVYTEYNGTYYTLPVNNGTFSVAGTQIPANSTLCVMYMNTQSAAQTITIPANIVPDRVRLYITANLYGDVSGSGFIGKVQIEVPVAQLSGAQEISMSADGYSNVPISAMALAYADTTAGCNAGQYYAKISEYLTGANWYDGVTGLAIEGGDFTLSGVGSTSTLQVWAVKGGNSFLAPVADLTFTSGTIGNATIGAHTGIVTAVAEGSSLLGVSITAVPTIEAACTVTVTA